MTTIASTPPSPRVAGCRFCDIAAGEAPAAVVHRDERCAAFMAHRPTRPGEMVVIPNQHHSDFLALPDHLASELLRLALHLARQLRAALNPPRVGFVVNGFGIAHAHIIIVPQHEHHDITSARFAAVEGGLVQFNCDLSPVVAREELERLARHIRGS